MTETAASSSRYGLSSIALGFLAFAAIVAHFFAGPIDPPPPVEISIAEKAANIRDATVAALKGEEYEAKSTVRPKTLDDYLTYGAIGAAVIAILLAVIGFVRREPLRPAIAGAALGGLAITFQFAVIVFFGLMFAIMLGAVIDKLDFTA